MSSPATTKQLGEIFEFRNGRAFKKGEWSTRGLPIIRIQNLNNDQAPFNCFRGEYSSEILVNRGDLLFSWSGTVGSSFGPHIWRREPGLLNQHIFKVSVASTIDIRYSYYALRQITADIEAAVNGAVGLTHITKEKLARFRIPVPPLSEQRRIVSVLDESFAAIAVASANTEKNLENARSLFANHLDSVFVQGGQEWRPTPLADLCEPTRVITYGVIKLGDETPNGVPCLRTSNVRWLRIDAEGIKRIAPLLSAEFGRTVLKGGEVLVNVRGTLGGVSAVPLEMAGWNVSREVAVVPVDPSRINPSFLAYAIGAGISQKWLGSVRKGAAYIGVNIEDLRLLTIKAPSLEGQASIVSRLDSIRQKTVQIESQYRRRIKALNELRVALLNDALNGRLRDDGARA